jgi:D-alanyl-D-alanine carboxypeptidase
MFTLLTTLISFLAGGLPKLMDFFQDKSDKAHEIELAKMQTERELQMLKEGYVAQARVEEIRTEQISIQSAEKEREALYAHDIAIGQGAAQWVINARAMVRPSITYGLFVLFAFVEIFGFMYAWKTGVDFSIALDVLWDNDTQIIWASVVSFWFGTQAFSKK